MNSQEFLQLLVTQLTNQNPLNPASPTQLMAQTAQLTMVQSLQTMQQQMTTMSNSTAEQGAVSMIGKTVTSTDANGNQISGVVSQVSITSNGPVLTVGSQQVPYSSITGISS